MKNLKEKILNVFKDNKKIDGVMDDLSNYQKKLAKNITNPLFSKNAKNQMLKTCAELHNLEKTLYRYKTAKQLNKLSDAQDEQNNAEDIVLKGGISNVRYIWRSELSEKTCDECSSLDGEEFDLYDDIPPMPHPNCKCYIEIVENDYNNDNNERNNKYDERCDCLDDLFMEIEKLITNAETLQNKIAESIKYFSTKVLNKCNNSYSKAVIEGCINALEQIFGTVGDFIRNYNDMKEANTIGADKYFHSKANCDGSKRGELGAVVAQAISDLREFTDFFKNIFWKGMTLEETLEDSKNDQEANQYGREQGRKYPDVESSVLVDIYRPNGLPEQY